MGLAVGLADGAVLRSERPSLLSDRMRSPTFTASAGLLMLREAMGFAVFVAFTAIPTLREARAPSAPTG